MQLCFFNLFSNYLLESTATMCSTGFYQIGATTNIKFSLGMMGRPVVEIQLHLCPRYGKGKG
jgi:hypothetical protein